jgi:hypothetical protein
MAFDISKEIPRIGQRAELLASWYLRFNGFFPLPGFVLHDAGSVKQVGGQISDADILALRLAYTSEVIEGINEDICTAHHQRLDVRDDLIDFVIAEVTSKRECKFNWLTLNDAQFRFNVQYVIRRFGYWPPDQQADVVDALATRRRFESSDEATPRDRVRVRLLSFGQQVSEQLSPEVLQITHGEVLEYLRSLFGCYGPKTDNREGNFVSDHKQWPPMIKEIYNKLLGHKQSVVTPSHIVSWLFPNH